MRTLTLKPYLAMLFTFVASLACVQAQFTFDHIGLGSTGSITPNAQPGSFTFIGGGNDIWSPADEFDFAHATATGDFDVRVRVESLEPVARWTKAGLMARETLAGNSRMAFNRVTPPDVATGNGGNGANDSRFGYRTGVTAGPQGEHEDGTGAPEYPNGWLRLTRVGNVINAYASSDGLNWRVQGTQDTATWEGGALPAAIQLGLAVSRHSGADDLATAQFRDYGTPGSPAAISTQPASVTIEENFTATLKFSAPGGFDLYDAQWRKNGVDIPGATSSSYTTPVLTVSDSGGAYSVAIRSKSNGTTATSADAIVTVVPDTTKPTIAGVTTTPGKATTFNVVFSEPVNKADAETVANYSVSGVTLSSAELQADNKTVRIASSALNAPGCRVLTVNNVRDRAGTANAIAANSLAPIAYADGSIRYQQYNGIAGVDISGLTGNAKYPNNPDRTVLHNLFENPDGGGNHFNDYGARISGFLTAPVTGPYTFYVAADDHAELWLSTDETPANKVLIAREPDWAGFRNFVFHGADDRGDVNANRGTPPANISQPVNLQGGCRYFAEFIYKEGGGGDYGSVAWAIPGGPAIVNGSEPIGAAYLSPTSPAAVTLAANLPGDTSISENQNLNLSISITGGTPAFNIQWYKNGTAIPGANGTAFAIVNAKIPDSGTYYATVENGRGVVTSRSANVIVTIDQAPADLLSAAAPTGNGTQFDVVFNEPVNQADAQNLANYSLPGVTLNAATLQADNKTVRITCSSLYGPGCRTLTVQNIRDRAIPPNTLVSGTVGVLAAKGSMRYLQYDATGPGVAVSDLLNHPKFPNSADRIVNVTEFENPEQGGNNFASYGAMFQGYIHPPVSGPYRLYVASDDGSSLWLSTDENPANKVLVANEPIWSTYRSYTGTGGGGGGRVCPSPTACNIAEVNLQAGCKYFVQFIYKEGGGGDYGSVAWRLPGGADPLNGSAPIQAAYLSPFEVAASIPAGQPADATVMEGRFVTFTADIAGSPNLTIQWYKNGAVITGANGKSITVGPLKYPDDNGARYYVVAQNSLGTATSRTATITVLEDTEPPKVVIAAGSTTLDRVTITFDEILGVGMEDPFNYSVTGGSGPTPPSPVAGSLSPDGKTVTLMLDPMTPLEFDQEYTVNAFSITDFSGKNTLAEGSASFHSVIEGCAGVIFEAYNTGGGNSVNDLRNYSGFPNSPDFTMIIPGMNSRLAYPTDGRENYGARLRGLYVPPYSANWEFHVAGDDGIEVWLNPAGSDPAGKVKIFEMGACCATFDASSSAPQSLIGGHPYYMEVLYKEGGGGDYGQVAARPVGSTDPMVPIGARDVGQYAVPGLTGSLTVQGPGDQSVDEGRVATFSVNATSSLGLPICYQWFRDGVAIAGANSRTYSFRVTVNDQGAAFSVRASIVGNVVNSPAATLTVVPDTTGPKVVSAKGSDTFRNVFVTFDELVGPSAANPFNYGVSGLSVDGATLMPDGVTVRLETSPPQSPGANYTVTVNGVKDISAAQNFVDPAHNTATFTAFTFNCGLLVFEAYNGIGGVAVADLTANPNYPWSPSETRYMNTFDTIAFLGTSDYRTDFGGRVHGVFVPPVSGNWIFYLRSDDASELYLNPSGIDPAGKVKLTEEIACCNPFAAHASAPQALVAGQKYFIEGIYKEGGGGDYIQVAAKLDTDSTDPNTLQSIGSDSLGIFAAASGAQIRVTQDVTSQTVCINPLEVTAPTASFSVAGSATPDGAALKSEDFNSGNGGFTVVTETAFAGPWMYDATKGVWHADGQEAELSARMSSRLTSPTYTVSRAGVVRLALSHRWSFEPGWDGGQVRVSINGGAYTAVPAAAFTENSYNGSIIGNSVSELAGQNAFINNSAGHDAGDRIQSIADLATLAAGDTISVQFLYAADTNTRGAVPNWEIDSVNLTQGGQPGLPVLIQWQRNNGTGWKNLSAFGRTLTFDPTLADNGAKFRAQLSSPGSTCVSSSEGTLTVIQMNTPPQFDLSSSDPTTEDGGARSVLGFASNVRAHSIPRNTTLTFDRRPPNTDIYGVARIAGGVAHMTDAGQGSALGGFAFNLPSTQTYSTFEVSWKSYIGDGGGGGADGYSLNIGNDLQGDIAGSLGEEGKGTKLSVTIDTFNNADIRAAGDEGIAIMWGGPYNAGGTELAFQAIPKDNPGNGIYLRKSRFVDAKVTVAASGVVTFTYDAQTISGQIPSYAGIPANRVLFFARTGGANDNQWLDNISGSEWINSFLVDSASVEDSQHVTFDVTNDHPEKFSQQPAISPNGTLTYTPAANACGDVVVTVKAHDDGGVACNGDDTSDPKTFTIHINCVNDCPLANAQAISAPAGRPISITLTGTDADGDALSAAVASNPAHGTLSTAGGTLSYTANASYRGPDSFTFTVNDGTCTSAAATVSITVVAANPPHCVANISPSDCGVTFPNNGKLYAIASTEGDICLTLNGSGSSDPDGDALTMNWVIDVTNTLSGPIVSTCLPAGCHTVVLNVSDGRLTCQQQMDVCVVTPSEMCEQIISLVENTQVERKNKRPLIVSLKAAKAAFEADGWSVGGQMLQVFQHKVRAQISRNNPAEGAMFDAAAADVIRALECTTNLPPAGNK